MSEPFLAEIRIVGFNFAPRGWAFCDGQILPISQNQSLYSLLGTTYGGDGRTSFALPGLRGRTPIHVGQSNAGVQHNLGQKGGEEAHAISLNEMPAHSHTVAASNNDAEGDMATGNILGRPGANEYAAFNSAKNMGAQTISTAGTGQAHNNMQPYLAVNFCIALQGLFPSRN
jgi:microcystin-dependent protein